MNKKIKKLWIAALRSGEYTQVDGQLRRGKGGFCCLGVLCNLHAQAHPEIAARQKRPGRYMGETGFLPEKVQEWAGLTTGNGTFQNFVNGRDTLAELNDNGYTFPEIADVIKEQF